MSEGKKITLTKAEIEAMPREQFTQLIMSAQKVEAKAVVIGRDGKVKYDRPELAGTYGEENL